MYANTINVKSLLIAAAVALLLLVGAGVAFATGSGSDSSERQATGPGIEKAKSVALDHTNGGRVTGTEIGDEEGYYEVEVIRDAGYLRRPDARLPRDALPHRLSRRHRLAWGRFDCPVRPDREAFADPHQPAPPLRSRRLAFVADPRPRGVHADRPLG